MAVITGTSGDDILTQNAGEDDQLDGLDGQDTLDLSGMGEPARLYLNVTAPQTIGPGQGSDTLRNIENAIGTAFDDLIVGGLLGSVINGGSGNDTLLARGGDDDLNGGPGNDFLSGSSGNDRLNGLNGNDVLRGGPGTNVLDGSSGLDRADYSTGTEAVFASLLSRTALDKDGSGDFRDTLFSIEELNGSAHGDTLVGNDLNNKLFGLEGDDFLDGRGGIDTLAGGSGDDVLLGGDGRGQYYGGTGNDYFRPGTGRDKIVGEDGTDTIDYSRQTDGLFINLQSGRAFELDGSLITNHRIYTIENAVGTDAKDTMVGNDGANLMQANDGDDHIDGKGGDDVLDGRAGNDTILGGDGDDQLIGGDGDDYLRGDEGADAFQLSDGLDVIADFEVEVDTINAINTGWSNFEDLIAHTRDEASGAVIYFGTGETKLAGVNVSQLSASDFDFDPPGNDAVNILDQTWFQFVALNSSGERSNGISATRGGSTPDGRFIVFESDGTNLYPNDSNNTRDVFVRDLSLRTTELISQSTSGEAGNGFSLAGDISDDGRFVLFESNATNLVENDTNSETDLFLRDRILGTTIRVSISNQEEEANDRSVQGALSANGKFVVFSSSASNLVPGDDNFDYDIFLRDLSTNSTTRISQLADGSSLTGSSLFASISDNGKYVAFRTHSTQLSDGATLNVGYIVVFDRETNTFETVSINNDGELANLGGDAPSISSDGRYVAYRSGSTNLIANDDNRRDDIFVFDRESKQVERVSESGVGVGGDANSYGPAISPDGRFVAFSSRSENLGNEQNGNIQDIFLHDRHTGETRLITQNQYYEAGNADSASRIMRIENDHLVFGSGANNLIPGATVQSYEAYVHNYSAWQNRLEVHELPDNAPNENGFIHQVSQSITFIDLDLIDTHKVTISPSKQTHLGTFSHHLTDSTNTGTGSVELSFAVEDANLDFLNAGEKIVQSYVLSIEDSYGAVSTADLYVTLVGSDDSPML